MFKTFLVLSMLLAFTQFSLAASTQLLLVSPVEKFLPEGQAIELGSAQPGERIELIFSANSGFKQFLFASFGMKIYIKESILKIEV